MPKIDLILQTFFVFCKDWELYLTFYVTKRALFKVLSRTNQEKKENPFWFGLLLKTKTGCNIWLCLPENVHDKFHSGGQGVQSHMPTCPSLILYNVFDNNLFIYLFCICFMFLKIYNFKVIMKIIMNLWWFIWKVVSCGTSHLFCTFCHTFLFSTMPTDSYFPAPICFFFSPFKSF